MAENQYKEIQRMRMWWVYVICILITGGAVWAFVSQIIFNNDFGSNPGPDWVIYATLALAIFLDWLIFSARLMLLVDSNGVSFRYYPFTSKKFAWSEIKTAVVEKYDPIKDYSGWGLRYNWNNKGKAYTISGNLGLSLTLKNDKKVLIGTARAEELQRFIESNNFLS